MRINTRLTRIKSRFHNETYFYKLWIKMRTRDAILIKHQFHKIREHGKTSHINNTHARVIKIIIRFMKTFISHKNTFVYTHVSNYGYSCDTHLNRSEIWNSQSTQNPNVHTDTWKLTESKSVRIWAIRTLKRKRWFYWKLKNMKRKT